MNPYSAGRNPYEYNLYGDSANGNAGSYSPGAILSRGQQGKRSASNPYAGILDFLPGGGFTPNYRDPEFGAEPITPPPSPGQPPPPPPGVGLGPGNGEIIPFPKDPTVEPPWLGNVGGGTIGQFPPGSIPGNPRHPYDPGQQGPRGYQRPPLDRTRPNDPMAEAPWIDPNSPKYSPPEYASLDEWGKANAAATTGLQYGTGFLAQQKDAIAAGTADPKAMPDDLLSKLGYSPDEIAKMRNAPSGAPSPPPPTGNNNPDPQNRYGDILSQLQGLLGPQFQYEQNQLNRNMNQQASVLGDLNAGGYRVENDAANSTLVDKQNSRLSDYLMTAQQSDMNRALQKYIADEQAATSRYGADQSLLGAKAGAGAGVSAAQIAALASKYGIDANLLLGNRRLDLEGQQNLNSYNLGLAGLGLQQYEFDNPSINALLSAYLNLSPEQMSIIGAGLNFPSYGYQPNYNPYYHP